MAYCIFFLLTTLYIVLKMVFQLLIKIIKINEPA